MQNKYKISVGIIIIATTAIILHALLTPAKYIAQAAQLDPGCVVQDKMLNCDFTTTTTRLEVYNEAKDGTLTWYTPPAPVPNVSKYQALYPYASTTVLQTIMEVAQSKGYADTDYLMKLINCESHENPYATNAKGNYPIGSVDRGIAMWSSFWQSGVSDECAFSVRCSVSKMVDALKLGHADLWVCSKLVR